MATVTSEGRWALVKYQATAKIRSPNIEIRNKKKKRRNPNDAGMSRRFFVIRASCFFRHSTFVLRHSKE